jgi:hypothetical protein
MSERILPSAESLKRTSLELLRTAGRIITLRAFLPEQPLASHGDHLFEHPLDEPVEQVVASDWPEKKPCPSVDGRDIGRPVLERTDLGQLQRGWSDMGEYLEREA